MSKVLGDNTAVLVQKRLHWDRSSGETYTEIYSGPEQAAIAKYAALIGRASGDFGFAQAPELDCAKAGDGARWELVAKWDRNPNGGTPTVDDSVNTDELLVSSESQSILQSPRLQELLPVKVMLAVSSNFRKATDGEITYENAELAIRNACINAGIASDDARATFDDLVKQRTNYYAESYVYRRTYTVSGLSSLVASFVNRNMIHTTGEVRSAEGTPDAFPLPVGEWRKQTPSVVSSLRQKTQITYSYEWGVAWGRRYYYYVSPPPA